MLRLWSRSRSKNRVCLLGFSALACVLVLSGPIGCNHQRIGITDDGDEMPDDPMDPDTLKVGTITVTPPVTDLTLNGTAQTVKFRARSSLLGDITDRAHMERVFSKFRSLARFFLQRSQIFV